MGRAAASVPLSSVPHPPVPSQAGFSHPSLVGCAHSLPPPPHTPPAGMLCLGLNSALFCDHVAPWLTPATPPRPSLSSPQKARPPSLRTRTRCLSAPPTSPLCRCPHWHFLFSCSPCSLFLFLLISLQSLLFLPIPSMSAPASSPTHPCLSPVPNSTQYL